MAQGSDLYKDRVEVSLDGRQIFYLFFGGAVVTCMVFVLGVVVGKKVEARSHVDRSHNASARDPLAALDRLENGAPLTFRASLTQGQAAIAPVEQEISDLERVRKEAVKGNHATGKTADKTTDKTADKTADKASVANVTADKGTKFTLQLSSFQKRSEAEAFADTVRESGFASRIIEATVEGKGTFYRVRSGAFKTMESAEEAKAQFERKLNKSAIIAKM